MPKKRLSQEEIHQKEPLILRDPERHKKWLKRKARKEQKENEKIIEKLKDEGKVRSIAGFFTVQEDNVEEDPWMSILRRIQSELTCKLSKETVCQESTGTD